MSDQWGDQASDPALVQRALSPASARERELALKAIYDRYSGYVLGLCGYWLQDPDDAMDAAQSTFATLIETLPSLLEPAKLRSYLGGIAKNQCREVWRQRGREGEFPERDLEDVEHEIKVSARRQAEVDRMLDTVAVSLTSRQGQIYRLVFRQGIRGQALAAELDISEKEANDLTYEIGRLLADGFGAYVLARDGRRFCTNLAGILDKAAWDGVTFTHLLRQRILWHLGDCPKLCDNCPICNPQKSKLIAAYTPVTIPILLAAELHDRIYQLIERLTRPSRPAHPDQPDDGMGATASGIAGSEAGATLDAAITGPGACGPGTPTASAAAGSGTQAAFDGSATQLASSSRTPHFARAGGRNRRRPSRRVIAGGTAAAVALLILLIVLLSQSSSPSGSQANAAGLSTGTSQSSQPSAPNAAFTCPTAWSGAYQSPEVTLQPILENIAYGIRVSLVTCSGQSPTVTCTAVNVPLHPASAGTPAYYLNGTYACTATGPESSVPYLHNWKVVIAPDGSGTVTGS